MNNILTTMDKAKMFKRMVDDGNTEIAICDIPPGSLHGTCNINNHNTKNSAQTEVRSIPIFFSSRFERYRFSKMSL